MDPPVKRMRLGTRSCAECRRRKVRCIFPTGSKACEGCSLHDVVCKPQQIRTRTNQAAEDSLTEGAETNTTDKGALQRRLTELEDMVLQIQGSSILQSNNGGGSPGVSIPSAHIDQSSLGCSLTEGTSRTTISSTNDSPEICENSAADLTGDASGQIADAPLTTLWRDSIGITPVAVSLTSESTPHDRISRVKHPPAALRSLLPCPRDLDIIFQGTEKFWPTWPPCTLGITEPKRHIAGYPKHNKEILFEAINSGNPELVSKALLWIALCLSQFSRHRSTQEPRLPLPPVELIERYLKYVQEILSTCEDVGSSLGGLECYVLQWRLYFDAGRPRKSWQMLRQAITSAIPLGLHRTESHTDERKKKIWTLLWQSERQLSCMLGLPSCTSTEHPGTLASDLTSDDPIEIVHHKLSILAGDIIKRDQNHRNINHAITIQLDEELEELRAILPAGFWDPPKSDQPFVVSHIQQYTKIRFWSMQKILHMPYMLKSTKESKYQYSFMQAMEAAKGIMNAYRETRQAAHGEDMMCEVMDFQVFSAAMVLIIGLLARPASDTHEVIAEWQLVDTTSRYLRQAARALGCNVAKQGSDTLDIIIATMRGAYPGNDDFVTTIPYFGRVRLNFAHIARASTGPPNQGNTSFPPALQMGSYPSPLSLGDASNESHFHPSPSATIQFSGSEFGQMLPMDFSFGTELATDWMSIDPTLDMNFDWTQEYTCNMFT